MGKCSNITPDTENYQAIYDDFKKYADTGREPFAKVIGGKDHYNSRALYKAIKPNVFRSHAQKIAKKVCVEMKLGDYKDDPPNQSELANKIRSPTNNANGNSKTDANDSSDGDYTSSIKESGVLMV
jgi:hypothetical protein